MKSIKYCLFTLWAVTSVARASQWFVSTNGSGVGSITNPWGLQVALTNAAVLPGDTIWLRGGTYIPPATNSQYPGEPMWWTTLTGATNNLIALRSYTNEWARIDRPWIFYEYSGINLYFRDLEFYDSLKGHHPTNSSYPQGPWVHFKSKSNATGNEWINCVVHDVDDCWANETTIRGCIIWHVGLNGYEHVCYPVGNSFVGNISAWHVCNVVNLNEVTGATIRSNIMFGAGQSVGGTWWGDILTGSGNYEISHNYIYNYYPTNLAESSVYLCSSPSGTALFADNVIASQDPVRFTTDSFVAVTLTNNVLCMNSGGQGYQVIQRPANIGTWTVNYNAYFARSPNTVVFRNLVTNYYTFGQWQAATGFDSHSTSTNASLPTNSIYVIPNQDQPMRAHIAVYNWSHDNNVSVNLTNVLAQGDSYQLYNAQDYGRGPIQTGIVTSATISLPMTNLTTAPVLYGTNWGLTNPPPMSPEFGAFVIIGSSNSLPPATNLRVLPSSP
jgi:hypothetical protein